MESLQTCEAVMATVREDLCQLKYDNRRVTGWTNTVVACPWVSTELVYGKRLVQIWKAFERKELLL